MFLLAPMFNLVGCNSYLCPLPALTAHIATNGPIVHCSSAAFTHAYSYVLTYNVVIIVVCTHRFFFLHIVIICFRFNDGCVQTWSSSESGLVNIQIGIPLRCYAVPVTCFAYSFLLVYLFCWLRVLLLHSLHAQQNIPGKIPLVNWTLCKPGLV